MSNQDPDDGSPLPDNESDLLVYELQQNDEDQENLPPPASSAAAGGAGDVLSAASVTAAVAAAAAVVAAATTSAAAAIMPQELPLPEYPDDDLMPAAASVVQSDVKRLRVDRSLLQQLMTPVGGENASDPQPPTITTELLQSLATYIVKETSAVDEDVASGFLSALIPVGERILSDVSEVKGFPDLMIIMITLAGCGSGSGHLELISAIADWLEKCRKYLCQKDVMEKLECGKCNTGRHQVMMDCACYMLSYLSHVYQGLRILTSESAHQHERFKFTSSPSDGDEGAGSDNSNDRASDDPDDDEEDEDGSDQDCVSNKLCTFTVTQKEFMNQHWYHCHTCKMTDRVGVCTVCAKVCHKDHDVTYAKYGSFFCDCGAREDGACIALVRRPAVFDHQFRMGSLSASDRKRRNRRRASSDDDADDYSDDGSVSKKTDARIRHEILSRQLQPHLCPISEIIDRKHVCDTVLSLMEYMSPAIISNCKANSSLGTSCRCKQSMRELHTCSKKMEQSELLMVPTLGSQEGAFENVKLSYAGDQGQIMRQLISSNVIRRVAMCALTSPFGKRQHLAVSHEKGKITLLQLSALLKQADSSKRKLTLTRLASAPVPFVALSIDANPCHEDLLAVCGLKDCHVLTFSSTGTVLGHLLLSLQLESGNHVIRSVWLPGSQTQIAVVTADFVKIFDLSVSSSEPEYYFLPPSGKIRDITLTFLENGVKNILMLTSSGYIYSQNLNEESQNGPFYVTNVLEVKHEDIGETSNGVVCGGGVSIYYSQSLQLLFVSYGNGKAFAAAYTEPSNEVDHVFLIEIRASGHHSNPLSPSSEAAAAGASSDCVPLQVLCQWREVAGHPGLVLAMSQQTNNPIVFLIKPDVITYQEIKFISSRSKITDIVAVRHTTGCGDMRTTLILLCEDGSLRIFMANQDQESTNFWLKTGATSAVESGNSSKKRRQRKLLASSSLSGAACASTSPSSSFPVDFFENCNQLTDIEFGGSDVLQIYNTQQLKNRLQTAGMYVASTKSTGFSIDVTNNDANIVIVGLRILVGSQDVTRAPSYIEIFGRSTLLYMNRARWYDLPLTREESLTADKKISITFGPSNDPNNVTMVDSIKVYGKSKESFLWPDDEGEEAAAAGATAAAAATSGTSSLPRGSDYEILSLIAGPRSSLLAPFDRFLAACVSVLDGHFSTIGSRIEYEKQEIALTLGTELLTLPFPAAVQQHVKSLILTLHPNKNSYYNHRDSAVLSYVSKTLVESFRNEELDGDTFYRLLNITRSIATSRPQNLIRYCDVLQSALASKSPAVEIELKPIESMNESQSCSNLFSDSEGSRSIGASLSVPSLPPRSVSLSETSIKVSSSASFVTFLNEVFWKLFSLIPEHPLLARIPSIGLTSLEATVQAMIEIIHAFTIVDVTNLNLAAEIYMKLLLCENTVISFAAKQSIIRILKPKVKKRRVFIPSPVRCESPIEDPKPSSSSSAAVDRNPPGVLSHGSLGDVFAGDNGANFYQPQPADVMAQFDAVAAAVGAEAAALHEVEQQYAQIIDISADGDEDATVELAIALSLQEQGLPGAVAAVGGAAGGHYSDTTASDDEGSTAATDGSTLRTSPVQNEPMEAVNEPESESGGSPVESIVGDQNSVSGRSSAYGEDGASVSRIPTRDVLLESVPDPAGAYVESGDTSSRKLHNIRLSILEHLIENLKDVREVGGIRCIPVMQVILMLTSDLETEGERDKHVLTQLLNSLMAELDQNFGTSGSQMATRTKAHEVKLIIMRLLSILMSRVKSSSQTMSHSGSKDTGSMITAYVMVNSNLLDLCLQILVTLLSYWKDMQSESERSANAAALLRPHSLTSPPDMSPFFLRQYVKGHADDVFELYPQLLSEMVLRLPYQIKKMSASFMSLTSERSSRRSASSSSSGLPSATSFSPLWLDILCEYMMIPLTPYVKKQVRKLLSYICGSKESYRQIRDFHALESHLREVKKICSAGGFAPANQLTPGQNVVITLSYDATISLIEHLRACNEIATNRTINWQKYCHKDKSLLSSFLQISFLLDEGVLPVILYLLNTAICTSSKSSKHSESKTPVLSAENEPVNPESLNNKLSFDLIARVDSQLLTNFIRCFLLESNSTALRWQAHALLYNLHKNFENSSKERSFLLEVMWSLWPKVPMYGRKSAQFVDLLGYFSLKNSLSEEKETGFAERAIQVLRHQNQLLIDHANSNIYNSLQSLVEFDGFYLESEPCLVCSNREVSFANMKLSSLKVDSRFTTTTQIVKLIGSHTISKITLRISDIKRSKMVRTLIIHYNNRAVQSVVELKNKCNIWHKAKRCNLASAQSEVKIEFPLPIIACNLMIEYAEFYENIQASSETLQCPRCSASVPASPGVCGNCGENVFQCHKCRAINYDEKDPFLCNSCGFCKYAKFDYTLTAKPTCAVESIENEEDRKKTVSSINALLEKADRVYKNLVMNKPALELLLLRIQDNGFMDRMVDDMPMAVTAPASVATAAAAAAAVSSATHVNRAIQQIAYKYCSECKTSFEELSKIIQKVLASRKELVDYDNKQREMYATHSKTIPAGTRRDSKVLASLNSATSCSSPRCYGCASATVEQCIILLKSLATIPTYRQLFCSSGLLRELLDFNLRSGSSHLKNEVRHLLCTLTKDNTKATAELNSMITDKIMMALKSRTGFGSDFSSSVRHEVALLITSIERDDSCWEQGLRCVMQIFLQAISVENPIILETIILPCLRLLISLVKPEPAKSKKNADRPIDRIATVNVTGFSVRIDLEKWLSSNDSHNSFRSWKGKCQKGLPGSPSFDRMPKADVRSFFLTQKYVNKWKLVVMRKQKKIIDLNLSYNNWLRTLLFNRFSRTVRVMACSLIEALFQIPSRSCEIIDMLASSLQDLGSAGEYGTEFSNLFRNLISQGDWKYYLALKGVLLNLGTLITREIDVLNELEETTLSSDLSEGCALKMLVDLLTMFVEVPTIRQQYKTRLVVFVLNGYLSLRKLVVQRTKIIDETQEALLELLEEMTTGTEAETENFMSVCIDAVNKCRIDDLRTPVFIFEQICSIIYPEEAAMTEFYITLEKDAQQEDFLQGRMLGNPYSSNDPGMGPLMRDVKNKICMDCELIALLEDDSGMELLVNNKIISLDLPVKEVFRKIWCVENNESESMRIVYRMRGLMGDATEEFIESVDSKDSQEVDHEVVYRLANRMSTGGGLEVLLQRLQMISDLSPGNRGCRQLLVVLLKLLSYCVKVSSNRRRLIDPNLKAVQILLSILRMAVTADASEIGANERHPNILEQLLTIVQSIALEASNESADHCASFSRSCGTTEDIVFLLTASQSSANCKANASIMNLMMRVLPLLTLGDEAKMAALLHFFQPFLNFKSFDVEHTADDEMHIESFCILVNSIEKNDNSRRIKDMIVRETSIISDALEHMTIPASSVLKSSSSSLIATSEELKELTQRPALKYVLRILTGLASGHEESQVMISMADHSIPVIHGLEQVSSDSHVGSLAESLLDALKQNTAVAAKIEQVRKQTRQEKKRLAMAVRQKQLGQLGMSTNDRGQVKSVTSQSCMAMMEELAEETGLTCIICREGYKFQPTKVLAIYSFTKRCPVEPYEGLGPSSLTTTTTSGKSSSRKQTIGYSTVTHFNIVHVDCHMAAVRHARARDEWDSASLQNANTRCNGLIPLWGTQVQESAFASCLARHNTYLQEATGHRDISYSTTIHDLKILLHKFANEESFSSDSGGGGGTSNIHLIPYLVHMALYVINTTRSAVRESKRCTTFLEQDHSSSESCFEAEGVHYYATLFTLIFPPAAWLNNRITFLKRFLFQSYVRSCLTITSRGHAAAGATSSSTASSAATDEMKEFRVYKSGLAFFALIDGLYNILYKDVVQEDDWSLDWPLTLAEAIRRNDQQLLETSDRLLSFFQEEVLSCNSFPDFVRLLCLTDHIPDPDNFLSQAVKFP